MGKRKKYVTYEEVMNGLARPSDTCLATRDYCGDNCPECYIRDLRDETGLSYPKIAHDLRADSGTDVTDQTVYNWGKA